MPYIPAERGTYQVRRKRVTDPVDTGGLSSSTYGQPYYDLVVFWDIEGEDKMPIIPVTIGDVNGDMSTGVDVWYGPVTTLLPADVTVVR